MMTKVAVTIHAQLGAERFNAMVGAREFVHSDASLQFRFMPGAKNRANRCKIVLMPNDTYNVTFYRVHKLSIIEISKHSDVYGHQLRELFKDETGLDTHL